MELNDKQKQLLYAALSTLKPKPRLTISKWADQYRYVAKGTSPQPGRWKTSKIPYSREIMDTFNTDADSIVFMASSQVGKSEIALNVLGYYIAEDPSSIMYLMPTDKVAEHFTKMRIDTTIRETPVLNRLFSSKTRDGSNTMDLKIFQGGYLAIHGANAPGNLSSKPIRILIPDEIDRMTEHITSEGSPLKLAKQRTVNFYNRKIFYISSPTVKETSAIVELFNKSDQRYYYVPCPDCGHEFVLKWEYVKWEKDADNELIKDTVRIECPACFFHIKDKHKNQMLASGHWVRTVKHNSMPGFHISSLYSPWVKFRELVREFIEATRLKDKTKLREFLNLKLGEAFEESTEAIEYENIIKRREFYDCELPDKVLCITCGVDVQDNRLAVQFVGWCDGKESYILEYKEILGDLTSSLIWQSLDDQLQRTFKFKDGNKLGVSFTCIDSAGHFTDEVYDFVKPREHRRIVAIIGRGGEGKPIDGNFTTSNRKKVALFTIGVDTAKEVIYHRLQIDFEGNGYIHFPREPEKGCDDDYFKMLLSEKRVFNFKNGKKRWEWKKIIARNEALDTFVYALGALEIFNPNFELLKQRIKTTQVEEMRPVISKKPQQRRIISPGINIYE